MTHSEIYAEAARRMEAGDHGCSDTCGYSCCALAVLCSHDDDNAEYKAVQGAYREIFAESYWWGKPKRPDHQDERILALCFMAAIAEDEES